jgi:hypothetical protein
MLLLIFAFNILYVSGANDNNSTCTTLYQNTTNFLPPSITNLVLNYPASLPISPSYYTSTSGDIEVTITLCSGDNSLLAAVADLMYDLAVKSGSVELDISVWFLFDFFPLCFY